MTNPSKRRVSFTATANQLLRLVRLPGGREYTHACDRRVLEEVIWYIEEHAEKGASTVGLTRELPDLPLTQVNVALAFLYDQGLIERAGRRAYPATAALHADGMGSFHYLAETKEKT